MTVTITIYFTSYPFTINTWFLLIIAQITSKKQFQIRFDPIENVIIDFDVIVT